MVLNADEKFHITIKQKTAGYSAPVRGTSTEETRYKKTNDVYEDTGLTVTMVDDENPLWWYVTERDTGISYWINMDGTNYTTDNDPANMAAREKFDKRSKQELDLPTYDTATTVEQDEEEYNDNLDLVGDIILTGTTSNPTGINNVYKTQAQNTLTVAMSAYGSPPQWTKYADPRILSITRSDINLQYVLGRRYAETVVAQPTILSMCPGIIEFNASALSNDTNFDSLGELITKGTNPSDIKQSLNNLSGNLVRFTPTWEVSSFAKMSSGSNANVAGYLAYVNTLSKIFVTYLGRNADIGTVDNGDANGYDSGPLSQRTVPKLGCKYSDINWGDIDGNVDLSIFGASGSGEGLNYKYVNFYVSGQLSVDETFDTTVRSSSLEDNLNGQLSTQLKDVAFITGRAIGGNDLVESDLEQVMSDTGSFGGIIGNLFGTGMEMLRGGKVILPQIVDDCTYGKSCQFTCKFISPAGDVESIFWNVLVPYFHLMPFVLPQQIGSSIDMYSYPFMCRATCKGLFNCPMGVVRGFRINRGGSDNELWTNEGLPTEIEVQFEITPLYSKLMLSENSTAAGVAKFIKNTGLQEYVGTLTAVDIRLGELDLRITTALSLARGWFNNIPDSIVQYALNKTHVADIIHGINELEFLFK